MLTASLPREDWRSAADLVVAASHASSFEEFAEIVVPVLTDIFAATSYTVHPAITGPQSNADSRDASLLPLPRTTASLPTQPSQHQQRGADYELAWSGDLSASQTWKLAVHRAAPFQAEEQELAQFLQPHLARLARVTADRDLRSGGAGRLTEYLARETTMYLIVTADGRIVEMSASARQYCLSHGFNASNGDLPTEWTEVSTALRRLEDHHPARFIRSVRLAGANNGLLIALSARRALLILPDATGSSTPAGLTRREQEILQWLGEGKTNADIATLLIMSPRTVQKHCEHLFAKLGVGSRLAAVGLTLPSPNAEPHTGPGRPRRGANNSARIATPTKRAQ